MSAEAYQHRLGRGAFHGMIDRTPLPLLNTSLIPLFFPFSSLLICFHVDGWRRLRRSRAVSHCTKRRPSRLEFYSPLTRNHDTEESRRICDALSLRELENLGTEALYYTTQLTDSPLARGFVYSPLLYGKPTRRPRNYSTRDWAPPQHFW